MHFDEECSESLLSEYTAHLTPHRVLHEHSFAIVYYMERTETIQVRVKPALLERLNTMAIRTDSTLSQVVRSILVSHFEHDNHAL